MQPSAPDPTPNDIPLSATLFGKYLSGQLTPEERTIVDQWLVANDDRATAVEEARQFWDRSAQGDGDLDVDTALTTVLERMTSPHSPPRRAHATPRLRTALIGAAALGVFGLGILVFRAERASNATPIKTYHTAPGQQATVMLASGARVTLAPATSLTVAANDVTVQGEAYFDITPNPTHPLVVHTANVSAQVLGTRFAVRQYAADPWGRVVVEDGKVAVRPRSTHAMQHTAAVLTANMVGVVVDSGVVVTRDVHADDLTGWRRGELVFRDVPLGDVVTELERAYGTTIRITDTVLARQPMTMTAMVQRQPLSEVLEFVGYVTKSHYMRVGDAFIVTPGRGAEPRMPKEPFPHTEKQYGR